MKKCELCNSLAKMYCKSDHANLCWHCDGYVHSANPLVAKHLRTLLCHVCQSLTPWTGTGPMLAPTVSGCNRCASNLVGRDEEIGGDDEEGDHSKNDGGGYVADEKEEENQVVPLSSSQTPPVSTSSNKAEESLGGLSDNDGDCGVRHRQSRTTFPSKRSRGSTDPTSSP